MNNPEQEPSRIQQQPIPLSREAMWDDFRRLYAPPIVFTTTLIATAYLWTQYVGSEAIEQKDHPALPHLISE